MTARLPPTSMNASAAHRPDRSAARMAAHPPWRSSRAGPYPEPSEAGTCFAVVPVAGWRAVPGVGHPADDQESTGDKPGRSGGSGPGRTGHGPDSGAEHDPPRLSRSPKAAGRDWSASAGPPWGSCATCWPPPRACPRCSRPCRWRTRWSSSPGPPTWPTWPGTCSGQVAARPSPRPGTCLPSPTPACSRWGC